MACPRHLSLWIHTVFCLVSGSRGGGMQQRGLDGRRVRPGGRRGGGRGDVLRGRGRAVLPGSRCRRRGRGRALRGQRLPGGRVLRHVPQRLRRVPRVQRARPRAATAWRCPSQTRRSAFDDLSAPDRRRATRASPTRPTAPTRSSACASRASTSATRARRSGCRPARSSGPPQSYYCVLQASDGAVVASSARRRHKRHRRGRAHEADGARSRTTRAPTSRRPTRSSGVRRARGSPRTT